MARKNLQEKQDRRWSLGTEASVHRSRAGQEHKRSLPASAQASPCEQGRLEITRAPLQDSELARAGRGGAHIYPQSHRW